MLRTARRIELSLSSIGSSRLREDILPAHGQGREAPQIPHLVMCSNERGNGRISGRAKVQQGPPGQLLLEAVS